MRAKYEEFRVKIKPIVNQAQKPHILRTPYQTGKIAICKNLLFISKINQNQCLIKYLLLT
jgi:hypothetical protein